MAKTVFQALTVAQSSQVNDNFEGAYTGAYDYPNNSMQTFRQESIQNFVASGCTFPVPASSLTGVIAAGVVYVGGIRTTPIQNTRAYTASKDTYVDIDNTGTYFFTEVTVGAAAPALTAGRARLFIVTTSGSAITAIVNTGLDSLGNPLYRRGATGVNNIDLGAASAVVLASASTASSTMTDLGGSVGPTINVVVGAKGMLLVGIACQGDPNLIMGVAMSGANTIGATDDFMTYDAAASRQTGTSYLFTGLTPGLTTLQAKYRAADGTTRACIRRRIWAVPL